jgi:hypothetical protein
MKKIRILFEVYHLYHLPQYLPFFALIKDDPRFDIYFTTSASNGPEARRAALDAIAPLGVRIIDAPAEPERIAALDALQFDFLIIGWSRRGYIRYLEGKKRPVIVMIYHGIGIKAAYYRDNGALVDFRVAESPYRARQLENHGCHAKTIPAGFIKLDPLFAPGAHGAEDGRLRERLKLDPAKKTVLYAPTFYPASIGIVRDQIALQTRGYNLIIKLHNFTQHFPEYRTDYALIRDVAAKYDHVRLLSFDEYNIVPVMRIADLMITDASSVMFEYLPLDRPLIVFTRYKLIWRHFIFRYWFKKTRIDTETAGYNDFFEPVRNPKRLRALIEENLSNPEKFQSARRRVMTELLHFTDGKSAQRLLDWFEQMLSKGG